MTLILAITSGVIAAIGGAVIAILIIGIICCREYRKDTAKVKLKKNMKFKMMLNAELFPPVYIHEAMLIMTTQKGMQSIELRNRLFNVVLLIFVVYLALHLVDQYHLTNLQLQQLI